MPDDSRLDAAIIQAAYAEKVREAFKVFAENLGMGQNQKNSLERFVRSLDLVRKARDMALAAAEGANLVEPTAPSRDEGQEQEAQPGGLSVEDQALIEQALAGTTGQKPLLRRR